MGCPTRSRAKGGAGVHLGAGEEADLLELLGAEQVRLVDDEDDPSPALGLLRREEGLGLGHHLGLEEARGGAQRGDDRDVEAAGAEGGVGDVDDLVRGRVEGAHRGPQGDGLADADLADEDAEQRLADAEPDAGDGLLVGRSAEQVGRGDGLGKGGPGEAEVPDPGGADAHDPGSSSGSSR